MKKENNKVYFTDENGNQTILDIYFSYFSEERNKEYVFFYSESDPDTIIAGYVGENDEILDIEDDEEYDELEEVLDSFVQEHEQGD